MFQSPVFRQLDDETFRLTIPDDRAYKILQLTDLHLGLSRFSKKKDYMALHAVTQIIHRAHPDLIIFTGDQVFPYLPKAGTLDNRLQAKRFIAFMDRFEIPYTMVFGNHDTEMGAKCGREELAEIFASGKYSFFTKGNPDIFGVGNFIIELTETNETVRYALALLDSNMYGNGWFYSGFDCIHDDQTQWCMKRLELLKEKYPAMQALAFFHMPPREIKEAYAKMKQGNSSVTYKLGSIGEKDSYFGISNREGHFFEKAKEQGLIKGMFFGHDHLNTLSLEYQGIRLTYGMSIDYLGYKGIEKFHSQRGGTLITIETDNSFNVSLVPLTDVVSPRVRGFKN